MLRLSLPDSKELGRRGSSSSTLSTSSTPSPSRRARSAQAQPRITMGRQRPNARPHETVSASDLNLGQLFLHTREAVVVGNVDTGRIALWNPAAEQVFGYRPDEIIGQPIHVLIPPAIARLHAAGLEHFARTGRGNIIDSDKPIEVPAITKDGQEIRIELNLTALEAPQLKSRYVAAIVRDVSERKRMELLGLEAARADAARTDVARALAERDALLDEGTRDLRVRVKKLQRTTARWRRAQGDASERQRLLARVADGRAETLKNALDLFADRAAIQAGTFQLHLERVNLVPLLGRVVSDARARSHVHRMRLAAPQGLTVNVDADRLEQVVRLLLQQACQRSARGCWIDVELRRPLVGLARLEVRDYGRPLTAARRTRLMQPNGREAWLSVSRHIIEKHGGTLQLEFPSDGGLRVVVTLPTQAGHVLGGGAH